MRRITTQPESHERGVAGVLVALIMLVLIGAGALAVDAGQIYAERAQLQNGADAASVAVAQACSKAPCTQAQANALAISYANENSLDGGSNVVLPVDLSVANQVTVVTSTRQGSAGPGFLSKMFASALNAPPVTVGAKATASAAAPGSGSAFPLAISDDCYNLSGASTSAQVQQIAYKPGGTCTGPSGTQIPGGWGWLDQSSPCVATTQLGTNSMGSDPGNDKPAECEQILTGWIALINGGGEVKVTFPVFDVAAGTGTNGTFNIIGYATFKIWGWKFGNNGVYEFRNKASDPGMTNSLACAGGNDRCIIGQFVKYVTIGSGGGTPGVNLGTVDVRLIN